MRTYCGFLQFIDGKNKPVRDNFVEGQFLDLPCVGQGFVMTAPPLEIDLGFRFLRTSPVVEVTKVSRDAEFFGHDEYLFKTLNSTYSLLVDEVIDYE